MLSCSLWSNLADNAETDIQGHKPGVHRSGLVSGVTSQSLVGALWEVDMVGTIDRLHLLSLWCQRRGHHLP